MKPQKWDLRHTVAILPNELKPGARTLLHAEVVPDLEVSCDSYTESSAQDYG